MVFCFKGCTPLDGVIAAQKSEEDADFIGCETREVAGRKEVINYLKRFAPGHKSSHKTSTKQPEMMRRNQLFYDDDDDVEEDEDDDDDIRVSSLKNKSQTKRKNGESRRHPISPIDSDDDEDLPVPKTTESSVPRDPVAEFTHNRPRNESRKTSKSPLRQKSSSKNSIDCDLESQSGSENEDDFSVEFEDESSCSPVNYVRNDSATHETAIGLVDELRRRSLATDRISIDNESRVESPDWQARDQQYSSLSYVDFISGKRANANGTRDTTPALISESDLGSTNVTSTIDVCDWLIDDMPERPPKRRRTNKQATLGTSMALSRRGPSTYTSKTPRNNSVSSSARRISRPKQARLEVRRTPSPTFLSSSQISTQSHHGDDSSANAPFQSHSSGPSLQLDTTVRQTSGANTAGGVPPMRVRVQVQGKTFLIPCPEKSDQERKTIAWLAEQV
jgi:hypothetical protein